jgi:hypothetical protein
MARGLDRRGSTGGRGPSNHDRVHDYAQHDGNSHGVSFTQAEANVHLPSIARSTATLVGPTTTPRPSLPHVMIASGSVMSSSAAIGTSSTVPAGTSATAPAGTSSTAPAGTSSTAPTDGSPTHDVGGSRYRPRIELRNNA